MVERSVILEALADEANDWFRLNMKRNWDKWGKDPSEDATAFCKPVSFCDIPRYLGYGASIVINPIWNHLFDNLKDINHLVVCLDQKSLTPEPIYLVWFNACQNKEWEPSNARIEKEVINLYLRHRAEEAIGILINDLVAKIKTAKIYQSIGELYPFVLDEADPDFKSDIKLPIDPEQKAVEQGAAEQKAVEQEQKREEPQEAAEQKAAEQKAVEQEAAEQKAAEQKAVEQEAAEQKAVEQEAAEQKAVEQEQKREAAEPSIVETDTKPRTIGDMFCDQEPYTLRDVIIALGIEATKDDAVYLGSMICNRLADRVRTKQRVFRFDKYIHVNQYYTDELPKIIDLMVGWALRLKPKVI